MFDEIAVTGIYVCLGESINPRCSCQVKRGRDIPKFSDYPFTSAVRYISLCCSLLSTVFKPNLRIEASADHLTTRSSMAPLVILCCGGGRKLHSGFLLSICGPRAQIGRASCRERV